MSNHQKITIGLFGFGVVGEGLYRVLTQTPSLNGSIKKVCIKHPEKKRNAPAALFTTSKEELLNDDAINVIVEVIDDAKAAFDITRTALQKGKAVVSASKKMIAEHLPEILRLQQETGLPFLYESAACASIPVIRNLEEYYDNDLLHAIRAIVNGSTNFILTKMFEEKIGFDAALKRAQELGFAESDPLLDVAGFDAANKWVILLNHAYGIVCSQEALLFSGIQHIQLSDAQFAEEKKLVIRLVAQAQKLANGKVAAFVLPQLLPASDQLAGVKNEYNGVVIESGFADKQFFYGKGAGSLPTGSAVLSDISALRYHYRYEYKKLYHHEPAQLTNDFFLKVFLSFDDWTKVPREDFLAIEEWHSGPVRSYLTGIIHYRKLKTGGWWRRPGISLLLLPDAVIEPGELSASLPLPEEKETALPV